MTGVVDVLVVGAGAAGLLAATRAAERGRSVVLLEKNRRAGVKILMSGGTRCNLTHAVDKWGIIEVFGKPGLFLHSALAALGPSDLVQLIEAEGVATKVEPGGKIFPTSNKASDVLNALLRRLQRSGARLISSTTVTGIEWSGGRFFVRTSSRSFEATRVIITTGGSSYPGCGTTGDGYAWAKQLGHGLVRPRPALVPITVRADWVKSLRGVTLPDVRIVVAEPDEDGAPGRTGVLAERRGSILMTHFGLSGPVVLDVSRSITSHRRPRSLELVCDFLPDMPGSQLEEDLAQWATDQGKKQIEVLLSQFVPRQLSASLVARAGLAGDRRAADLPRAERVSLIEAVKRTRIPVTGTMGFKKAEVTAGGVPLLEIDSRTMQSKIIPQLYWAGEILDLDGPIGGYNFQAAFSTGWLAGESV